MTSSGITLSFNISDSSIKEYFDGRAKVETAKKHACINDVLLELVNIYRTSDKSKCPMLNTSNSDCINKIVKSVSGNMMNSDISKQLEEISNGWSSIKSKFPQFVNKENLVANCGNMMNSDMSKQLEEISNGWSSIMSKISHIAKEENILVAQDPQSESVDKTEHSSAEKKDAKELIDICNRVMNTLGFSESSVKSFSEIFDTLTSLAGNVGKIVAEGDVRTDRVGSVKYVKFTPDSEGINVAEFVNDLDSTSVNNVESESVNDVESESVNNVESKCVNDTEFKSVNDVGSKCVNDAESKAVNNADSESVKTVEAKKNSNTLGPANGLLDMINNICEMLSQQKEAAKNSSMKIDKPEIKQVVDSMFGMLTKHGSSSETEKQIIQFTKSLMDGIIDEGTIDNDISMTEDPEDQFKENLDKFLQTKKLAFLEYLFPLWKMMCNNEFAKCSLESFIDRACAILCENKGFISSYFTSSDNSEMNVAKSLEVMAKCIGYAKLSCEKADMLYDIISSCLDDNCKEKFLDYYVIGLTQN